jgi:hypothetical protein
MRTFDRPGITFTPEKVKVLRKEYDAAVKRGDGQFVFEGHELDSGYAKYLLEYLEGKFNGTSC